MQTSHIKKTTQGEAWDIIAKREYGSEYAMDKLLQENPEFLDVLLFSGNKEIKIPEQEKPAIRIPAIWE